MSGPFDDHDHARAGAPIAGGDDATAELPAHGADTTPADEPPKRRRFRRRPRAEAPAPEAARPETAAVGAGLDLPAGTDLDKLVGPVPTTRRRGRLRRRLRHLRSVREVLLRDLGGMVFEARRARRDDDAAVRAIVDGKLDRLAVVDSEIKDLEDSLADHRGLVVREPGIGGTCPSCGELFGSEARFCWACGTPVAPGAQRPPEALPSRHVEGTAIQLPPPPPPPAP